MINWKKKSLLVLASLMIFGSTVGNTIPAYAAESPKISQESLTATKADLASAERFALLWMRSSAEYRALCYQGYNAAESAINKAIKEHKNHEKPLAIILDCDETVVDNTKGMSESMLNGNGHFDAPWWRAWLVKGKGLAMPGATKFLQDTHKKGVEIFYVTGRAEKYSKKESTNNLIQIGFPQVDETHLLMYTSDPDKQSRFDKVTTNYNVILYMGDNIGDFPLYTRGKNLVQRQQIIDKAQKDFGTKFIMFPNPAYGSWVSSLAKGYYLLSPEDRAIVDKTILSK